MFDAGRARRLDQRELTAAVDVSIESPDWRDSVEDAVEMTDCTPAQARASEAGSLRSPSANSTPRPVELARFCGVRGRYESGLAPDVPISEPLQTSSPDQSGCADDERFHG